MGRPKWEARREAICISAAASDLGFVLVFNRYSFVYYILYFYSISSANVFFHSLCLELRCFWNSSLSISGTQILLELCWLGERVLWSRWDCFFMLRLFQILTLPRSKPKHSWPGTSTPSSSTWGAAACCCCGCPACPLCKALDSCCRGSF